MSLEALYNDASPATYVGKVRTTQEASSGARTGVNFMDGTQRSRNNERPDEFQTEFTRNSPGANVAGGAQPLPLASSTPSNSDAGAQTNTRWTNKSFKLAFDASEGAGPSSLAKGFYHTPTTFRVSKPGMGMANIHNYTPASGYITANTFAGERYTAGPTST